MKSGRGGVVMNVYGFNSINPKQIKREYVIVSILKKRGKKETCLSPPAWFNQEKMEGDKKQ